MKTNINTDFDDMELQNGKPCKAKEHSKTK